MNATTCMCYKKNKRFATALKFSIYTYRHKFANNGSTIFDIFNKITFSISNHDHVTYTNCTALLRALCGSYNNRWHFSIHLYSAFVYSSAKKLSFGILYIVVDLVVKKSIYMSTSYTLC